MDLSALEIFRAVAAEGSVTRAAERLGRVQSNVTTRVQQLEEQLGATLFLREGRRMALTPAGTSLVAYADRLLALAEEARQALHPGTPRRQAAPGRHGKHRRRPPARPARPPARPDGPACNWNCARARRASWWTRSWPTPATAPWSPGRRRAWIRKRRWTALPSSPNRCSSPCRRAIHRWSARGDLQVDTLAAFSPGCTYRRLGEDWMRAQRHGAAPHILELASYHAILACVAAGRCAGVVPQSVIDLMREPPALRWVPLAGRETVLVRRRGWHTPALDALLDALRDVPAGMPPGA